MDCSAGERRRPEESAAESPDGPQVLPSVSSRPPGPVPEVEECGARVAETSGARSRSRFLPLCVRAVRSPSRRNKIKIIKKRSRVRGEEYGDSSGGGGGGGVGVARDSSAEECRV